MVAGVVVPSVDVEDWVQSTWNLDHPVTDRVVANCERLLEILDRCHARATLFVQGMVAEAFPALVKRLAAAGHEIASHGHAHRSASGQTPSEFRADVSRAKSQLEDIIGAPVLGYRAPDFSIGDGNLWALDVLAETGHEYDSSIVPARTRRYGIAGWPAQPVTVRLPSGASIVEVPPATLRVFRKRRPVAGGGYHRLLPWALIRRAVARHVDRGEVFMAYAHPYEFNPDEFGTLDVRVPLKTRLHQGLGRRGFRRKFERMLTEYPTATAIDVVRSAAWPEHVLPAEGRA